MGIDVMISLQVRTMNKSAFALKEYLEKTGLKVWVCTQNLQGGDDYRTEIVNAVKSCKVFLPLINSEWADSGECADEFGLAKRLNLTSHERGNTKEGELRRPIFCPVAFPNLVWNAHAHVELLAANTNFIVHDRDSFLEGNSDTTFQNIALSLATFGLKMDLKAIGISVDQNLLERHSGKGEQEMASSKQLIQELTATIQQQMAFLRSLEQRINNKKVVNFIDEYNPLILRPRYIGGCANLHMGCEKVWALEFRFVRGELEKSTVPLTGEMEAKCIQVKDHDGTEASKAEEAKMKIHIEKEHSATVNLKGGFVPKRGLVYVDAQSFKSNEHSLIALCEYRLVINTDGTELTGVFDRGDPKWTAAVRLTAY